MKNGNGVVVKAHDESPLYLQSRTLDKLYTLDQVSILVLLFLTLGQTSFIRSFDPNKNRIKAGLHHHLHQLFVISQIYGGLGIKGYPSFPFLPFD